MKVEFNSKEYARKAKQNTYPLRELCFDIFVHYLNKNHNETYNEIRNKFNKLHCTSNQVVLNENDFNQLTDNQQQRYYDFLEHNGVKLFFTTQWGNNGFKNGKDCDNIKHVINFAKEQGYDIKVLDFEIQKEENISSKLNIKNIILYGTPGVGKTHNYQKLISMIEEGKSQKEIFDSISQNEKTEQDNDELYKSVKNEKRVEFVTFHQSYSYEDFIEGFRPNENGDIKLEDGTFKKISDKASENIQKNISTEKLIFRDAINVLFDPTLEDETVKINLKKTNSFFEVYDFNRQTLYYTRQGKSKEEKYHTLSLSTLEQMYNDEENNIISGGLKNYYEPLLNELLRVGKENKVEQVEQKNYYIVIDEINRGNISKIFGELITLIEEDKRDGYEVTLPYSKEPFRVPSNLYIIATMNSTDKSIATVDIALRRRFTFLKMEPKAELVTHVDAKELMIKLNEHIVKIRGGDYRLGHSYFMKVEDEEDLEFVKEYKIKPLLEEYFYADEESYKKAVEILGNDNV